MGVPWHVGRAAGPTCATFGHRWGDWEQTEGKRFTGVRRCERRGCYAMDVRMAQQEQGADVIPLAQLVAEQRTEVHRGEA
jgi:hypothetical protein